MEKNGNHCFLKFLDEFNRLIINVLIKQFQNVPNRSDIVNKQIIENCLKELKLRNYEVQPDKKRDIPCEVHRVLERELKILCSEKSVYGRVVNIEIPQLTRLSPTHYGYYIVCSFPLAKVKGLSNSKTAFSSKNVIKTCYYFEVDTSSRFLDPMISVTHSNKKWNFKNKLPKLRSRDEIILDYVDLTKTLIGAKAFNLITEGKASLFKWTGTVPSNVWVAPNKNHNNYLWHSEGYARPIMSLFESVVHENKDHAFSCYKLKAEVLKILAKN